MRNYLFIAMLLLGLSGTAFAQKVAIKSNILYDATGTINLGMEFGLGKKTSLDISGNYNGWKWDHGRQWKHWLVQPEFRYWLCERFNGHFFGIHGHYADFNFGKLPWNHNMRNYRYDGNLWGAGLSYGYSWVVGKRWNIEATIGVGYARMDYDKYPTNCCQDQQIKRKKENYWGPTKIGLSVIYVIH